jgi:hypothetical protein
MRPRAELLQDNEKVVERLAERGGPTDEYHAGPRRQAERWGSSTALTTR